jgi:hypothetical protein
MATVNVTQTRSNVEGGHRVTTVVNSSTIIPKELFVFKREDNSFTNVATVKDMVYPTTSDPAWTHYRLDTVTRDFSAIGTAIEFAAHVKERLLQVTNAYTQDVVDFVGTETIDIP